MRRISVLPFLLVFCSATAVRAQAPAPKPGPEVKKMHAWVGNWMVEGEIKAGPLGPAGKHSGEMTCQMILGGFFLQCRWTDRGPAGDTRGLEVDGYDPVNKDFSSEIYFEGGGRFSGMLTIAGNTWTYAGKWTVAGKQCQLKDSYTFAPDLASATQTAEFSTDGNTWTPFVISKWTKVKLAPKK